MKSDMFLSIRTDIGSDFKVRCLCKRFGMEALAWWLLTLCELYQEDGLLDLSDELSTEVVVEKFSTDETTISEFFGKCADLGLINTRKWHEDRVVFSESLWDELEYRKTRSETGKMGGRPKKKGN